MQSASLWVQCKMLGGRKHAASHQQSQSQQPVHLRDGHQAKGEMMMMVDDDDDDDYYFLVILYL